MTSLMRFVPKLLSVGNLTTSSFIGSVYETSVRTIIRWHFPRPSERKRIVRHGWKQRMSTPAGRRILMNRILKGRHVYSH
ncbi:hypothetical protein Zmor_018998 [Zophobas morio]|uniref:Large ribosomal subunit protein bL34m n=1 Tax=Zophobas morio TaxID=2755281 RepID=A0AA38IF82_9CUCU|nr:hypothetical protein Zmor_018998 [Zophobas morio]